MPFAHGRASLYVSSDIGATSPGRWHVMQLAYTIGATSLFHVGVAVACAALTGAAARHALPRIHNNRFLMAFPLNVKLPDWCCRTFQKPPLACTRALVGWSNIND